MVAREHSPPSSASSPTSPLKVVHIFSPRIFKSDARSFRSLVQCLTGNKRHSPDSFIPIGCIEITPRKRLLLARENFVFSTPAGAAPSNHQQQQQHLIIKEQRNWEPVVPAVPKPQRFGSFSEADIVSSLLSSETPLPDCTMLPPLAAGYELASVSVAPAFTTCRYPSELIG